MAKDPLKAEDVASVGQERARERVAQDVGGAAGLEASPSRQSSNELMNPSRG